MDAFLIAARTLHIVAAVSLTGVFAFVCLVAGPAFQSGGARLADAGELCRRLSWLSWVSLVLVIVSGAAWLAAVAAGMSGRSLGAVLSQDVLAIVLLRTRFGEDWLLRLALATLLALCLATQQRFQRPRVSAAADWSAFLLSALMLAALAWAGHGAADPGDGGNAHLVADILHLLAAGVWLGALAPLALLLAEARRVGDQSSALIARAATTRFSAVAVAGVGILLASGVANTWFLAGSIPALVGTDYGRLLLLKIALFGAMLLVAAVNLLRLSPRLADPASSRVSRTIAQLRRNALFEAGIGLGVLAVVGVLGTLPPGSHTEPRWPFPVRADIAVLQPAPKILLAVLAAVLCVCAVAAVAAAAAGRYRPASIAAGGFAFCLAVGWLPLRSTVERAYPTSFYAPTEPYAADSVARGATLYSANCAVCHGASGHGDGPAAAALPIRPADLTEPHLFAHNPGDLFWWVSRGGANGVMPGFDAVLKPSQRWDVINFVLARAAGDLAREVGPNVMTAAAYPVPEFAFESGGAQDTLRQELQKGPVLLVLFADPAPRARLWQLAAAQPGLAATGLNVVAVRLANPRSTPEEIPLPAVDVSADVIAALALFRTPADGGETELMLDRGGNVRSRWTAKDGNLPDAPILSGDAARVARIAIAAPSHAGHAH
jgi:putative copper resistance protein D